MRTLTPTHSALQYDKAMPHMRVYENASLKDPRPKIVGTSERHMPKSEAHWVSLIAIPCQQADICR